MLPTIGVLMGADQEQLSAGETNMHKHIAQKTNYLSLTAMVLSYIYCTYDNYTKDSPIQSENAALWTMNEP